MVRMEPRDELDTSLCVSTLQGAEMFLAEDETESKAEKSGDLGGGNSNIFYFHPYLGKIPILTNIFQRG